MEQVIKESPVELLKWYAVFSFGGLIILAFIFGWFTRDGNAMIIGCAIGLIAGATLATWDQWIITDPWYWKIALIVFDIFVLIIAFGIIVVATPYREVRVMGRSGDTQLTTFSRETWYQTESLPPAAAVFGGLLGAMRQQQISTGKEE